MDTMDKKYYWIANFLEKYEDGTVKAFRTALHCKSMLEAVEGMSAELFVRAHANGSECLLYDIGIADEGCADLVGKAETDALGIDWPE